MTVALWVAQILLALAFLAAGTMKATRPKAALEPMLPWVADFSATQVRLIGVVEVLAALGLVLPALTGIAPVLTPVAAAGLVVVMLGAIVVHARRKEPQGIVMNVVLLAVAAFVAWGRFGPYAF
ncbi:MULTISPECIES: DoxX family protein [unclassified Actinotalea]|uniref:DoxX family protein n=1 Tax=unclassified Actinotalea TaxID=2638618 RepID=UPI0015F3F4B7|nr:MULTISPECIES: DoxX family protein [unclassified Actinotalea]